MINIRNHAVAPAAAFTLLLQFLLSACAGTDPSRSSGSAEPYLFDICLVTENELGSMGDPVSMVHAGREVKFCCAPCIRKFQGNPDKYLVRLDRWIAEEG